MPSIRDSGRAVLVALGLFLAVPAHASHVTILPDSTGDYATIGAAVAAMTYDYVADTILVEPGDYDEVVNFPDVFGYVIHGRAGVDSTRVRGFTADPDPDEFPGYFGGRVCGLEVTERVHWGHNTGMIYWQSCRFMGGWNGADDFGRSPPVSRCAFRDSSSFIGFGHELEDCSFEAAPIYVENLFGYVRLKRCTFTGPALQLARVTPRDNSEIVFESCSFSNAGYGILVTPNNYFQQSVVADSCQFRDLTGSAIHLEYGDWTQPQAGGFEWFLSNSRVTNCGQAVHVSTSNVVRFHAVADTIESIAGIAIESVAHDGTVNGVHATDAVGGGLSFRVQNKNIAPSIGGNLTRLAISDTRIRRGGPGVVIQQAVNADWDSQELRIWNTVVDSCTGAGFDIAGSPVVLGCISTRNGGDGMKVQVMGPTPACSLAANSLVANLGNGLLVQTAPNVDLLAEHILVTSNSLVGMKVLGAYFGSASFNDSWGNGTAAQVGLNSQETNLEANPLFCDSTQGDYGLHTGSQCGASGPYGTIGAFGENCAAEVSVASVIEVGPARLKITPNPARGAVGFDWSGAGPLEQLAIYDVQGRLRWSMPAGTRGRGTLVWDGLASSGQRPPAGVYLVRWKSGDRTGTARLIILGS